MEEGGMLLSHLLSRKEKVIRAVWGRRWIIVDCLAAAKGQLTGPALGTAHPIQLPTAKYKETRALCTQTGLRVSVSPFSALAQEGQPLTW